MRVIESQGGCLPTEEQVIFLKACILPGKEAIDAFEIWQKDHSIDAIEEGLFRLLPTLYKNLLAAGFDSPEMPRLKGTFRRSWVCNQQLFTTVEKVVQSLHDAGIETLLLKGLALAHIAYDDPSMRLMQDGDVLVHESDAEAAIALLKQEGWSAIYPLGWHYRRRVHAAMFTRDDGAEIDLHWHVFEGQCSAAKDAIFWDGSQSLLFRSTQTRTLCPTDHLIHNCIHGMKWNPMHPLRWIVDSAVLLRAHGDVIDWQRLVMIAENYAYSLRLYTALNYLHEIFALPIPQEVLMQLDAVVVTDFQRRELTTIMRSRKSVFQQWWCPLQGLWFRHCRLVMAKSLAYKTLTFPATVLHAVNYRMRLFK